MKSRSTRILSITAAALLSIGGAAYAGQEVREPKEIHQMARNASTPGDHAKVAKSYLLHSKSLESKAEKLEKDAQSAGKSSMGAKWPAMVANTKERNERMALQTRRAAQESWRLAEHHSKLAGQSLEQIASLD